VKVALNVTSLLGMMITQGLLMGPPEQDTTLALVEAEVQPTGATFPRSGTLQPTFGRAPFVVDHPLKTQPGAGLAVAFTDEPTAVKQPLEQSGLIEPAPAATLVVKV